MLSLKALSIAFRELQAPELEAAQAKVARLEEELAQVKDKLEEAEKDLVYNQRFMKEQNDKQWALKLKVWHLERDNGALTKQVEALSESLRKSFGETVQLKERLYKRRKKDSTNASA